MSDLQLFLPCPAGVEDLLADEVQVFAWAPKGQTIRSARDKDAFHVTSERVGQVGIALVGARAGGANLSGGLLTLRYRLAGPARPAVIDLKPVGIAPVDAGLIPTQIFTRLADTRGRDEEIRINLPATPGLTRIKELVLLAGQGPEQQPIGLSLGRVEFNPANSAPSQAPAR